MHKVFPKDECRISYFSYSYRFKLFFKHESWNDTLGMYKYMCIIKHRVKISEDLQV